MWLVHCLTVIDNRLQLLATVLPPLKRVKMQATRCPPDAACA